MKISVKVKLNAKKERVETLDNGGLAVWVKAKPVKGKANEALREILAEYFGVARSKVMLLRGHTSRNKIFEVLV
ncbi:MAG: DUF167 domain-containing protein [Candidatus Omnitrophica bacterium]|nr:DUF167 domain-containing protein [Candidatus Omnitrophota bacterium]